MLKNKRAITLIALIITVIILLILAAVSINFIFGQEGIFNKTQTVVDKYNKAEAEEKANLKVAEKNMIYYSDYQRKGELAEIAEKLENDEEVEYVKGGKPIASTDFSNYSTVIFKLKAYIYEFEMGEDLQVALLDKNNETAKVDGHREINPTGSINITRNGEYDVTNYANAVVNVPNTATYLYNEGDNEEITGGWNIVYAGDWYDKDTVGTEDTGSCLYISKGHNSGALVGLATGNKIDLTNINYIFFKFIERNTNASACIYVSENIPTGYSSPGAAPVVMSVPSIGVFGLDVSELTGSYYIIISMGSSGWSEGTLSCNKILYL